MENHDVNKLLLPLLLSAGMISSDCIDLMDTSYCRIDRQGKLVGADDFVKEVRRRRPHLFRVGHERFGRLRTHYY